MYDRVGHTAGPMANAPSDRPQPIASPDAFIAVKLHDQTFVVELSAGTTVIAGSGRDARIRIDTPDVGEAHTRIEWDGTRFLLREDRRGALAVVQVNGKMIEDEIELAPGDEILLGPATLVVGTTAVASQAGRKPLSHQEFHDRVAEEMSLAARSGRPTSLAMIRAQSGDGARIAQAALDSFRAGDVVGVYAPDELEFLLPDAPGDTARAALLRIFARASVKNVSAGVAVAPIDGDHVERLFRSARQALLTAERAGGKTIESPPQKQPLLLGAPIAVDSRTLHLLSELALAAREGRSVLLSGEASSGRGIFARQLHEQSPRYGGLFIRVRGNIPITDDATFEAFCTELTDALGRANGGTLLIEEICELPMAAQEKLRSLLEAHPDVCVIGTTHRNPHTLVERKSFDEALLQRIAQALITIPPLRERPLDIVPMAERFAIEFGAVPPIAFSPAALARLRSHAWPGNVLELRNAMERAVRLAGSGEILADYLPTDGSHNAQPDGRLREHVDSVERDAIIKALSEHHHNQTRAAKKLGISRRALIYKMEKYGLKMPPVSARK